MRVVRFLRRLYADNRARRHGKKSITHDVWRHALNRALRPVERLLMRRYCTTDYPVVFIVGAPRSGSTLLYQLLVRHFGVGYVTNAAARYWLAPVLGSILGRWRFGDARDAISLRSEFGTTRGPCSPHEFGYFWQFWMDNGTSDDLTEEELDRVNWTMIRRELCSLAGWFQSPVVLKNLNYTSYAISRLAEELPASRFIWIRREQVHSVRSILDCRVKRYGNVQSWWSIRPRDVDEWRTEDPVRQVCHQVRDVEEAIEGALFALPEDRRATVAYEELVRAPASELERLLPLLGNPSRVDWEALCELRLSNQNARPAPDERLDQIANVLGS